MNPRHVPHLALLCAVAALPVACGLATRGRPAPAEDGRSGAALASVTVHNQTSHRLVVAFRPATPPGGEVVVGRIEPGARTPVAPVPAGEPIVLIARTPERAELVLPPRTFDIDEEWLWDIPADAPFRARGGDAR